MLFCHEIFLKREEIHTKLSCTSFYLFISGSTVFLYFLSVFQSQDFGWSEAAQISNFKILQCKEWDRFENVSKILKTTMFCGKLFCFENITNFKNKFIGLKEY